MKLTVLEALLKTKVEWEWIRDNPSKGKEDYFEDYSFEDTPVGGCYLCEYSYDGEKYCSSKCPLFNLWSAKSELYCCENSDSPYQKWKIAVLKAIVNIKVERENAQILEDASNYANEIVKLCERKIKKLEINC